jgi:hypothetical protein
MGRDVSGMSVSWGSAAGGAFADARVLTHSRPAADADKFHDLVGALFALVRDDAR